jgi:hypothetical protein
VRRGGSALILALAGCATPAPVPAPVAGLAAPRVTVVERAWHTDLCVDAPAGSADPLAPFAAAFPGARTLCFGFGERQYLFSADHGLMEKLSALLPSRAVLLVTALPTSAAAAFGADKMVVLRLTNAGDAALHRFLRGAAEGDALGAPRFLRQGPYPGSAFYAAVGTYDMLDTCNTWTVAGLRAAGLAAGGGPVVFARQVMSRARRIAAAEPPPGGAPLSAAQ